MGSRGHKKVTTIKGGRGQAAVEFALILPVLMLLILGIVQVTLIFINTLMVNYAAYTVARVAVAYPEEKTGVKQAAKADFITKRMIDAAGSVSIKDGLKRTGKSYLADRIRKTKVEISDLSVKSAMHGFKKVTVEYNMPLTVPVVNRIMKTFLLGLDLGFVEFGIPYYPIKASSIMRIPVVNDEDEEDEPDTADKIKSAIDDILEGLPDVDI